uniref:PiggyBac transposable element-derived protein 4 n=1 Tax=Sipha flava TaxID=143950 RepID=A0A2S2PW87_9HEMI
MTSLQLNENSIVDCLYEDLPSDDQSCTTVDDTDDDQDYLPPQKAIIVVKDNEASDDIGNADEDLVDILNLNDNEILKLPSPYKIYKNIRSFNKNISRSLFSSGPTSSSTITLSTPEVLLPNISNKDNSSQIQVSNNTQNNDEFNFIPPTWSKNNKFSINPLSDFIGTTGRSDLIDKEQDHTPFSVFKLLFSDEVINLIAEQTNLYAQQRYLKTGKLYIKTTNQEIMTFLGINILMGIKMLPSYRDYWSSAPDLHDSYISQLMTVNRFGWLLTTIHLNDNNMIPKKSEIGYDKLYKVRPYLTILKYNFQKYYNSNKIIAVDESTIKFKGRSTLKQYMPKKPIKRGYKVWSLADKKGYLWNFEIYSEQKPSPLY